MPGAIYVTHVIESRGFRKSYLIKDGNIYDAQAFSESGDLSVDGRRLSQVQWAWLGTLLPRWENSDYKEVREVISEFEIRFGWIGYHLFQGQGVLTRDFLESIHHQTGNRLPR